MLGQTEADKGAEASLDATEVVVDKCDYQREMAPPGSCFFNSDTSVDHYVRYAEKETLDRVSLQDYGPVGWLRAPWILAMVVLTRYSAPRADFLFDKGYLAHHWKYYGLLWALWLALFIVPFAVTVTLPLSVAGPLAVLGWFFPYPVSWGTIATRRSFMARFKSRALALQVWETILWGGWYMQGVAYMALSLLPYSTDEELGIAPPQSFYDHPATIVVAVLVIVAGSGTKMYCAYLSGLNNYYYYDMMLARPNERFVDSGLYKWFGSPTYHLGYIDGYGLGIASGWLQRGSPMLTVLFTLACHISIFILNEAVEQPSVRKMYGGQAEKPAVEPAGATEES